MNALHIIQKFFKKLPEALYRDRMLWLFLFLVSVLSVFDITGAAFFQVSAVIKIAYIVAIAILKATMIVAAYSLCKRYIILKILAILFIAIYSLLGLVNIVTYELYGFGISRKLLLIFAQTTWMEVSGFLPGLFQNISIIFSRLLFYFGIIFIALLAWLIKKCGRKVFLSLILSGSALGMVGFVVFGISYPSGRSAHSLYARAVKYGMEVSEWNKKYRELTEQKRPLPYSSSVSSRHLANTVIVVIGESAVRGHHSIYGYPLPTNPGLSALRDSIFIFTDALASSKSTAGNMERILSFKEDDTTYGDGLEFPLVVDYFNQAGYKTFWLSNQERMGSVSNTSGVMAMNSDVMIYAGADNSEDAICRKYDEILLPHLEQAITDTASNKLIFLHLLGSHVEFNERYPESFAYFTKEDEIKTFGYEWLDDSKAKRRAEYDNSIRYTDSLLTQMISQVSSLSTPSVLIYLSDHGENVYDYSSYSGRDDSCAAVPFIIYVNVAYRSQNPSIVSSIQGALSRPFSTANLVHLLLTLTGSDYHQYNPALDVLSPEFIPRKRYVDEEPEP